MVSSSIPLKAGISLKSVHHEEILQKIPPIPWFEVHPENLKSGSVLSFVEKIREHYPLSLHGVGLSLGSVSLNQDHLFFLKSLCDRLEPGLVSEHVSWSYVDGIYLNDLLPLPYTEETLHVLVNNIQYAQEILKRYLLIENPSTYLEFAHSQYKEEDFIKQVACRSGCGILLDINNIYVSSHNHGWDAKAYIKVLATSGYVREIHLAGHKKTTLSGKNFLIDHHGCPVSLEVWKLYEYALSFLGPLPTLVEWDNHLPAFDVLWAEGQKANLCMEKICEPFEASAIV